MSSREDILQSIRRNTRVRYEKPDYLPLEQEALSGNCIRKRYGWLPVCLK